MRTKSKIWLGVGAFVVIGAGASGGGALVAEPAPGPSLLRAPTTDTAIAHVPAKWTPVRRQEHAPLKDARACSDSEGTEHALAGVHSGRIIVAQHAGADHAAKDKEAGEGGEGKAL